MERRRLLSALLVQNTNDSGPNSLRWAIEQANLSAPGITAQIDFQIPGNVPWTIPLASPLPAINVPVMIDGTTQPGYLSTPVIEIDGSHLTESGAVNGLVVHAGASTIEGLSLVGFSGAAILLQTGGQNLIAGNYLGLDPSGAAGKPNGTGLELSGSSNNTIGAGVGSRNVISGNAGDGIVIEAGGGTSSTANLIQGNLIGTSPNGLQALGNGGDGVDLEGVGSNSIGMPGQGFGNVISGNTVAGIALSADATGNTIQNNDIGVAGDGRSPLGNQGDGILLESAPGTTIGGTDPNQRNIISANAGNGIESEGDSAGLLITGNAIGTDATGQLALGNHLNGVSLSSSSATVGGTNAGAANVIDNNGGGTTGAGVMVLGNVDHDSILSNSIANNAGLGINFGNGPSGTHNPGTPGPNNYQNYPTLTLAQNDGTTTTIIGSLYESPNTSYLIQLFANRQADASGYGQGQTFLETTSVQTDNTGNGTFQVSLPPIVSPGMYISATATDPQGNTSEFSSDLAVQGVVNLVVSGTATPKPVASGSDVTVSLQVTNVGTADAQGVVLADQLPSGATLVSATLSQGTMIPTIGSGSLQFLLQTIPAGTSATATLIVQTDAKTTGNLTDMATVSSQETPNPDQATIPVTVDPSANLSVSMTEGPSPALVGGELTYTITTTNVGPQTAPNAQVVLPIASGLSFVSAFSSIGSASLAGGDVVASLGDLSVGSQAVVTVVVQAERVGSVTEVATATSDALSSSTTNQNVASLTTDIQPASDLSVTLATDSMIATTGVPMTYTITVANAGPLDATSVLLADTLPAGVQLVSTTNSAGLTPTNSSGVLYFTIATLPSGTHQTFTVVVDPTAPPGSTLVDSATVQGTQADPNPTNNTAQLTTSVRGVSDLSVTGTTSLSSVDVGQSFQVTIQVANAGPYDEPAAVLSATLPVGLVATSARSSQGTAPSVAQGQLTADLGALPAGHSAVVTLMATAGPTDAGTLLLPFSVAGQNLDTKPSNNSWTASLNVAPSADLSVQIVPSSGEAIAGTPWPYTVQVANAGPSTADGVIATIPVPSGTTFIPPSSGLSQTVPAPGADNIITVDLGSIASGHSASLTVFVQPMTNLVAGSIDLSAQVTGTDHDPTTSNNAANLVVPVAPSVSVAIAMATPPQVVQTGQVVTFTASVTNTGTTTATGVVVDFPSLNGLQFLNASPTQGLSAMVTNQSFARLGDLVPGGSASVTLQELAVNPGAYTLTASVAADQYNLQPGSSSATAHVVESPGAIELGTESLQVTDLSGMAVFPVVRLFGAAGTVTIHYQTTPIDATPGLDFTPTSGILTLGPGQWSSSIVVPVLNNPYLNHDTHLTLTIDSPTGGAWLGSTTKSQLLIQDANPDTTPPRISGLSWTGTPKWISSLALQFTAPLNPHDATNAADYLLTTTTSGQPIPIASLAYNPSTFTVTIVPASPIPSGQYDRIQVIGTGPSGIKDLAGNPLEGNGNGNPGSDYVALFAQGRRLRYIDGHRNLVRLAVNGRGYFQQVLYASSNGLSLNLVGMVPDRTTLSGHVRAFRGGTGQTQIGQVSGLGSFGAVKVMLRTPPFLVNSFPFQRRGKLLP